MPGSASSLRARFWITLLGWVIAFGGLGNAFRKFSDTTLLDMEIGGALAVVGTIIALVAWRCPNCGAWLGGFGPSKTCKRCKAELSL